jgi:hypothetical protein
MATKKQITLAWCIAGVLWNVAGLIAAIDHRTTTAMMNVAIGMMFIVIGLASSQKGKKAKGSSIENPPKS